MKKTIVFGLLITAFTMLATVPETHGQSGLKAMTVSGAIVDTGTATATGPYHYGAQSTLGLQIVVTKVSGTVAGDCILQGTFDNSTYFTVSGADSLALADQASNTHYWKVTSPEFLRYRISCTGEGTMNATFVAHEFEK